MFITPGLYIFEYNILNNTYIKTIIIYFSSTLFLYNFILPWSWKFFLKFQTDQKISFFFEATQSERRSVNNECQSPLGKNRMRA